MRELPRSRFAMAPSVSPDWTTYFFARAAAAGGGAFLGTGAAFLAAEAMSLFAT